jgi:RecA-family ATPase
VSTLDAALAWAARGFRIFPLPPNGTIPHLAGWIDWASSDPATIRAWWGNTAWNIGVLTTGMLVVDIDTKKDRQGLASWMALHGGFDTLTVRTKSGGYHLYYAGADVGLNQGALGPGLDVRSHNGYVVGPGSIVDGAAYTVELDRPMVLPPDAVLARCKPPGVRAENHSVALVELDTPLAMTMAAERLQRTPGAIQGEQSEQAYKLACAVRDYGISEYACGSLMDEWAARCMPPIGPEDLRGRIGNAYAYAQNQPGQHHPMAQFRGVQVEPPPAPAVVVPDLAEWGNAPRIRDIPRRPYVLRGLLLRREVTSLLATGGAGKSLLGLYIAVHLACGTDCMGFENVARVPLRSVIYDAEDNLDEMSMRLNAICTEMAVDFEQVRPFIRLISGRNHGRLKLVDGGGTPVINEDVVEAVVASATDPSIGMLVLNPLNTLHNVNGNDNGPMTFVMNVIQDIAQRANVPVLVAHHTNKANGQRRAGNAEISQGASAVINGSRHAFTLTTPEDEDVSRYALTTDDVRRLVRIDDAKQNYSLPSEKATWLYKPSINLYNGEEVGALRPHDMMARSEYGRAQMARTLKEGMLGNMGQASVKITEAVTILKAEAMWSKLPSAQVKLRIQSWLSEAVEIEGGSRVRAVENAGSWTVIVE